MGGLFSPLTKTWSDGYQLGDISKSLFYDLNPLAWGLNKLNDKMFGTNNFEAEHNGPDAISEAIVNTVNQYTGNAHLTPDYQHTEEREDSVNQRTAEDMMAAGLSKFGFGGTAVGTSNASNGLTVLDAIGKAQQIKANSLAMREQSYNLKTSKSLGIRTSDKNPLILFSSLAKVLFGIDLPDEGVIPYFVNLLKDAGSSGNGSTIGASADAVGAAASTSAKASTPADDIKSAEKVLGTDETNRIISERLQEKGINVSPPPITSRSKDFGISDEFAKSANFFMRKMFNDDMLNNQTISHLAGSLSKVYNLPVREVLNYLNDIKKSFSGEVYRFDENDKLHRVY